MNIRNLCENESCTCTKGGVLISVTLKKIAQMTGFSRGTVDRVVHNRGGVKPDVEHLIRATLSETNYIPNKAGKILVTRRQLLKIGCFMPGIGNDFF